MASSPPPSGAMSEVETAAQPGSAPEPSTAAPEQAGANGATEASARPQGTASRQNRTDAAKPHAPSEFAALLSSSIGSGAVTTESPANAPAASIGQDSGDQNDAASTLDAALPDQLLALLGGAWSTAGTPATTPPAAPPSTGQGGTEASASLTPAAVVGGKPAAAIAAFFPATATATATATPADASAAPSEVSAGPVSTDPAAAIGTSNDAATPVVGSDASPAFPAFPNIAPTTASASETRTAVTAPLAVPADPQQGFDDGFGARLVWMAEQRLGHAEIRLNPEHLGPIDVRVQVDGTQVNAEFHSAHAAVRQTIEASMPRLRELLGQQGLQLGHADVGQRQAGAGQRAREDTPGLPASESPGAVNAVLRPLRSRGLLDEYA
ncbi:flagellar hook-length control protein FliK [Lysobacter yangpyeongensis]|uniref:Flagellar hook-length control protein FliK n=1 Tax=Lysobacter yangpyeongensis TaxID=346182 RepID=A0ABW0SJ55_9GAMM